MKFFAPGKLMISGEYVVLDGAISLAIPTSEYGQSLSVNTNTENSHNWISKDVNGQWFSASFSLDLQQTITTSDEQTALVLLQILQVLQQQKPGLFLQPLTFISELNFNRNWGWGSSSTLIANLAEWSKTNPFYLLEKSFSGSGYDLAVALSQKPILYQLKDKPVKNTKKISYLNKFPVWENVIFNPEFKDNLFLVYLNQKQNSRNEIKKYRQQKTPIKIIDEISEISNKLSEINDLSTFEKLLNRHEKLIAKVLNRPTVKEQLFSDYFGSVKSLGAWGGDFVLVTGKNAPEYFDQKGYQSILSLNDIFPQL